MRLSIEIPGALLLDRTLPPTNKVLWMLLSLQDAEGIGPLPQRVLADQGHLSRSTVQLGLGRLEKEGWVLRTEPRGWATSGLLDASNQPYARVPERLIKTDIKPQARVLYACLQLLSGFNGHTGEFTYSALKQLTGRALDTLRLAVRALVETGWLRIERDNRKAPVRFTIQDTDRRRQEREVADVARTLEKIDTMGEADSLGEALMYAFLDLLVASRHYLDHARPRFLQNPFTGELMELDRYYVGKVAFEFNGPQHYRTTEKYPDEGELRLRQARDYMKRGFCEQEGVKLVVIQASDLTLERMREKIEGLLPLRDTAGHEQLVEFLELTSSRYRHRVQQIR